jgi:hypothetical protein
MRGVVHVLDDDGVFVCQAYAAPLNAMAPKRRIWATPRSSPAQRPIGRAQCCAESRAVVLPWGATMTLRFCRCIAGRAHDCCGKCS